MKWLLIILAFTGPTSTDKIKVDGPYDNQYLCETAYIDHYRKTEFDQHVCIPIGKLQ